MSSASTGQKRNIVRQVQRCASPTDPTLQEGPLRAVPLTALGQFSPLVLLLAIVLPVGTLFRLLFLGQKSFALDEVSSVVYASFDWPAFVHMLANREANMTFYYCLLRVWLQLGHSEFAVRSLSLIASVATLPAIYAVAGRLFGKRVGLVSGMLLAVNAFHVRYGQDARSYSQLVLLTTLASLFFLRALERPSWWNWLGYAVSGALATYSHFFAVLVLGAHWVSALLAPPYRISWKRLLVATTAVGAMVLPLVLFALTRDVGQISWATSPDQRCVRKFLEALAGGSEVACGAYLLACLSALIAVERRQGSCPLGRLSVVITQRRRLSLQPLAEAWPFRFVLAWLFVPIALVLAASMVKPVFVHRFMIICLPPFIILAAAGLSSMQSRRLFVAALTAMVLISAYRVVRYYQKAPEAEDWRGATRYILTRGEPSDGLVFYHPCVRRAYEYYREAEGRPTGPHVVFPTTSDGSFYEEWDIEQKPAQALLEGLPGRYDNVWLVLSHDQVRALGRNLVSESIELSLGANFAHVETQKFAGVRVLRYSER